MSPKKESSQLRQALKDAGYRVELVKGGHWKVTDPHTGVNTTVAATPSDRRFTVQACQQLKRLGFEFTFRGRRYEPVRVADTTADDAVPEVGEDYNARLAASADAFVGRWLESLLNEGGVELSIEQMMSALSENMILDADPDTVEVSLRAALGRARRAGLLERLDRGRYRIVTPADDTDDTDDGTIPHGIPDDEDTAPAEAAAEAPVTDPGHDLASVPVAAHPTANTATAEPAPALETAMPAELTTLPAPAAAVAGSELSDAELAETLDMLAPDGFRASAAPHIAEWLRLTRTILEEHTRQAAA